MNLSVLFGIILCALASCRDLPDYFPRCKRFDPKIEECILNATITLRPLLKAGVPEIQFNPIDPLVIPTVKLQQGTSAVNFDLVMHNVTIRGFGDYVFNYIGYDAENKIFSGMMTVDKLQLEASYEINGKILVAPIQGKGIFESDIGKATGAWSQTLRTIKKRNVDYLEIIKTNVTLDFPGEIHGDFNGLFNGNEQLSQATNRILNDNIKEVINEMKPTLEDVVAELVHQMLARLVGLVPYDKLFPK